MALLRQFVRLVITLIELLLAARFVLKLLGAGSGAPLVAWIYETTQPLLQPFLFAFPTPSVRGGFVLEFTTLFALFAYAVIGYILEEIFDVASRRR